jgi:hypothetical protein
MEKPLDVDKDMLAVSVNTLNSNADNDFLIDPFPLLLDVVSKFYDRY